MKKRFEMLDYRNCLANLPNSVMKYFGMEPVGDTLPLADRFLNKKYKNVVVFLLDGLGTCILNRNLPEDSFLRRHFVESFPTVFPPTTVAATTAAMSGRQPIETAWLGWDCYFPQIDKNVTVFQNVEQDTENDLGEESVAWKYIPYEYVVDKMCKAGKQAYNSMPFLDPCPEDFQAVCQRITDLCNEEGQKYIYAYWDEPDGTMHDYGCYSDEAKEVIRELDAGLEKMCAQLPDTLLIVTADHGHMQGRNACIEDYPEIMDCLVRMPSIEPRALNLYIKEGKKEQFEKSFKEAFGDDFLLLTKEEVYESQLFGTGEKHALVDPMIGDYLAIAVSDLSIFNNYEEKAKFRGVHAGYTEDEMFIPFIVIDKTR
ncbi:MAG: alkaline phosphatase family protein [Clostridiales bacterium]|nr:alkaline phosphatase family protein [Candidatus Blautia equi]